MVSLQHRCHRIFLIVLLAITINPSFEAPVKTSTPPVYLIVGGVSHTPAFFTDFIAELKNLGYESHAVALPTVGPPADTAGKTFWDEVTAIHNAASSFIEAGKDVILLSHSRGAWPASRAVTGLDKETRASKGLKNGIIEIVFLAAFLLPDNAVIGKYTNLPKWLDVNNDLAIPNARAMPLLFSDVRRSQREQWQSKFEWQRNDFSIETLPHAPWDLPIQKTYILTIDDLVAPYNFQSHMLSQVIDKTWSVKSIKSGHEPFVSNPKGLAKLLTQPNF